MSKFFKNMAVLAIGALLFAGCWDCPPEMRGNVSYSPDAGLQTGAGASWECPPPEGSGDMIDASSTDVADGDDK